MTSIFRITCLLVAVSISPLSAVEYFISLQGKDTNLGTSEGEAFRTIQKGVDALAPGDVLTIAPGEYFGAVYRKDLGADGKTTTIRAKIPGTVLLRGDRDVKGFVKLPDARFVYSVPWNEAPQGVHEVDTLTRLDALMSVRDLKNHPGSYFFDATAKTLFISPTDFSAPDEHRYTVSVIPKHGFYLENPKGVKVTGLGATGFSANAEQRGMPGFGAVWGFVFYKGLDCVFEDLTSYLNGGGIAVQNRTWGEERHAGRGSLIVGCKSYGNGSRFNVSGGNIAVYFPNADVVDGCHAYLGTPDGIKLYQLVNEFSYLRNCFTRLDAMMGIKIKGENAHERGKAERSISLSTFAAMQAEHSIIGTENYYYRVFKIAPPLDNIYLSDGKINQNVEFADPENFDFHLQSTSQFRGSGPGGIDRGPFPYAETIFYVKRRGDDTADGLSLKTAWASAAFALNKLRAGDTLYLEPGEYEIGDITLDGLEGKPTAIRGRGLRPTVLKGSLTLKNCEDLSLERVTMSAGVSIHDSRDIALKQSTFAGSPTNVSLSGSVSLEVTHCRFKDFSEAAIVANDASGGEDRLFLQSNQFENTGSPALKLSTTGAIAYSDYNSYANPDRAWHIAGADKALSTLRPEQENYSGALVENTAAGSSPLPARGAFGQPLGPHAPFERELKVSMPTVRNVTATTANLEWFTSQLATCELRWGPTRACENKASFDVNGYGTYSLTGLEPSHEYYFCIREAKMHENEPNAKRAKLDPKVISFTTDATAAAPQTYYVSTQGSDAASGLAPDQAWKTIARAADKVAPGDTVLIASGTYSEQIIIPATGDEGKPITFQAQETGQVYLDGDQRSLNRFFIVGGKSHLRFDGFYCKDFGNFTGGRFSLLSPGIFNIYESNHIEITRCISDGRGAGYSAPFVQAQGVEDLLVKNCVAVRNWGAIRLYNCPDALIENNVILRCYIQNLILSNGRTGKITLRNNILGDNQVSKIEVQTFEVDDAKTLIDSNNCYFFRIADEKRLPFFFGQLEGGGRMSATDFIKEFGRTPLSVVDNPHFAGLSRVASGQAETDYDGDTMLLLKTLKFSDFYPTAPEIVSRKIGLQPQAFQDPSPSVETGDAGQ